MCNLLVYLVVQQAHRFCVMAGLVLIISSSVFQLNFSAKLNFSSNLSATIAKPRNVHPSEALRSHCEMLLSSSFYLECTSFYLEYASFYLERSTFHLEYISFPLECISFHLEYISFPLECISFHLE